MVRPSTRETDIEHVVAASEAHGSGLCAADTETKARFARDLRNLTLASPRVNRHQKSGKDTGEWVPDRNRCWFAARVVEVRRGYGLTVDRSEAQVLERILSGCESTALEPIVCRVPSSSGPAPLPHLRVGTMRSCSMTTTGTGGLPAWRPAGMELPRCRGRIRRTGTCATGTGTGTGSCASNRRSLSLLLGSDSASAACSKSFRLPFSRFGRRFGHATTQIDTLKGVLLVRHGNGPGRRGEGR